MIPLWVILGLGAQCLWVVGSIIDKVLLERYFDENAPDSPGALLVISGVFSVLLALTISVFAHTSISTTPATLIIGLAAGVLNGIWVHLYLKALNLTEISRVVPVLQTIPIFGMVFAFLFLNETLSIEQCIGILLIASGAVILMYHRTTNHFAWIPFFLMTGAAGAIALQETLFKVSAFASSFWNTAFWLSAGMAVYTVFIYVLQPNTRRAVRTLCLTKYRSIWAASSINELIDNGANLIFAFAVTLGPVALVQSVNGFQPLILLLGTSCIALFWGADIKEDFAFATLTQKLLGVLVITSGSVLLYLNIV